MDQWDVFGDVFGIDAGRGRGRLHVKVIAWSVFLLLLAATAGAVEGAGAVVLLDAVEVTGSPIVEATLTDAYGSQKTRVSEAQINDLNAQDLETALRSTPGVNISRFNPIGSFGGGEGGGIFIRGMGSSRPGAEIKTLVDGVPMYMSAWNHPLLDLMPVDAGRAIEVYKSPQPQHFGNAFGVVNLVPKEKTGEGFVTKGHLAAGKWSTRVGSAEHGGRTEKVDYYLGCGYRSSEGHREDADGEVKNAYGRLGMVLNSHWDLGFFTLWNDNEAKDPGVEGADPALRDGTYETGAWLTTATLSNSFEMADGEIKFYRNSGRGDWLDNPTAVPGVLEDMYNDFLFYGVKAKESFRFKNGATILVGLDYDYSEGDCDTELSDGSMDLWDGHDFTLVSPYAAVSRVLGDEAFYVIPSAGMRYYANSDFHNEVAPHAGLVCGYGETEIHANYSRGVVYPGLEVVLLSEKDIPLLGNSWKDLNAEKTDHYEVGISQKFNTVALLDLTLFYDDGSDRYLIVPPPPGPPRFDNVDDFSIRGAELSLALYPAPQLALFAGLTLLDTDPSDLPYAPETTLSTGLNWSFFRAFKLSLDASFLSSMQVNSQARKGGTGNTNSVDSYCLVNGKLSYAFQAMGGRVQGELFVAGENLTDVSYEYLPGYPMPGVSAMTGVNVRL